MVTKKHKKTTIFLPEVWQMFRDNLTVLKDISGLSHEKIARRIYGASNHKKIMVWRAFHESHDELHDIEQLEQIARACGFDPLLLAVPHLRKQLAKLLKSFPHTFQLEGEFFHALQEYDQSIRRIKREEERKADAKKAKRRALAIEVEIDQRIRG